MLSSSVLYGLSTLLLTSVTPVSAFWRLLCDNPVTIGRYDPIVSPGGIAGHVHTVSGGSGFGMSTSYDAMRNASCTSCQIQQDLSNYWIPQLYYQNPNNGSFEDVGTIGGMTVYYLQRGDNVKAFPPGFQMLAGNPNLRAYNDVLEQAAINFVCLDYAAGSSSSTGLPTKNCPQGLRAQVVFPSCWNGKDLDSANHKSHMAYPDQISSGNCPAAFPVRLVTIFYEVTFTVDDFSQRWYSDRAQPFVFSQGDPTGYGLHGDFVNGWEQNFLQSAIDTCTNASGLEQDCPLFDLAYGQQCHVTPQVNEVVSGKIAKLPGCNPVQFGPASATTQTCANNTTPEVWNATTQYLGLTAPPTSHFLVGQPQTKTNYSSWQYVGCYSDGNTRTMSSHVGVSGNFTVETCLDSCDSNGFQYGAMENGNECWCSNTAPAQTSGSLLTYASCSTTCAGNSLELCGGGWALSIYNNTAVVAPTIPSSSSDLTASYMGCYNDNPNRIMPILLGTTNGTVDGCVSACQTAGYPYSGVEYMGQCFCSSSLPAKSLKGSDTNCNMICTGDKTKYCGAGYQLQVYSGPVTTATRKVQALPYAGCYTDSSTRSLSHQVSSNKTIEGCIASCTTSGYKIAGLEYGGECWCDNVVAASMAPAAESDCNMPCSGNQLEICGAGNRLSVYNGTALTPPTIQASVGGMQYAGCYSDDGNRVMKSASPKNQTIAGCVSTCQSLGYSQAGVEYGGECFCGPLATRSTKMSDADCSMTCNDDNTHLCGAGYRLQLYNTTSPTQSATVSRSASIPASAASTLVSVSSAAAAAPSSTASSQARVAPAAVAAVQVQKITTTSTLPSAVSSTLASASSSSAVVTSRAAFSVLKASTTATTSLSSQITSAKSTTSKLSSTTSSSSTVSSKAMTTTSSMGPSTTKTSSTSSSTTAIPATSSTTMASSTRATATVVTSTKSSTTPISTASSTSSTSSASSTSASSTSSTSSTSSISSTSSTSSTSFSTTRPAVRPIFTSN